MRLRITLLLKICAVVGATAPAAHARDCADVGTRYITAKHVRTSGPLSCVSARRLLVRYFRRVVNSAQTSGGCAETRFNHRGCPVADYRCHARYSSRTKRLTGWCGDGTRTVRFDEFDRGPGY
jgi:hypothetical protein